MYGSDQAASLEKNGMHELVKNIRAMEKLKVKVNWDIYIPTK